MAIQLAYHKLHNKSVATYETGHTVRNLMGVGLTLPLYVSVWICMNNGGIARSSSLEGVNKQIAPRPPQSSSRGQTGQPPQTSNANVHTYRSSG